MALGGNSFLMPITPNVQVGKVPTTAPDEAFSLEAMLPLELIREHTKTDDVPSVTDRQLDLYRQAAVEACELYTSTLLRGIETQTEPCDHEITRRARMKGYYIHRTRYAIADGVVHLFGSRDGLGNRRLSAPPNTRSVRIPVEHIAWDTTSCCGGPCTSEPVNWGMRIMYRAGFSRCDMIPAGLRIGMLKFVAWSIAHPGDEFVSIRDRVSTDVSGVIGTNNTAWASGAVEMWRQYDADGA